MFRIIAYAKLRSEELYCFAVMDTRKGEPQVKTGVMPSLLVLDYSVDTSQANNNARMYIVLHIRCLNCKALIICLIHILCCVYSSV